MNEPAHPASPRVVVVEDSVPSFVSIARELAQMGISHCEWKTSGWQVVQYADTLADIDLILLNVGLPYEDPYQALRKIRSHPRLKQSRVVAVATRAAPQDGARAAQAGFDGLLRKPLDPERFPEQVRRLLRGEGVWE